VIMMRLKYYPPGSMSVEAFKDFYEEAYYYKSNLVEPQHVYLIYGEDDKYVGFLNVVELTKRVCALVSVGFTSPRNGFRYFGRSLEELHNLGYEAIHGSIDNRNDLALSVACRTGFRITGFKIFGGVEWIEIVKIQGDKKSSFRRGLGGRYGVAR